MIGTYASVLAIGAVATALGRGITALSGERAWTWLEPAIGFAALLAVCEIAIRLPGHGLTAGIIVLLLSAVALWLARRRRAAWPDLDGAVVGVVVLVATAIPFIATGRVGLLGVSFNNDPSYHLLLAAGVEHPSLKSLTAYGPGYPVGPHSIIAVTAKVLGVRLDTAFTGLLAVTPVLVGLTALGGLHGMPRPQRWITAVLAAVLYLAASWYAQAAFKEPILALLLLALVLVATRARAQDFAEPWPPAIAAGVLLIGVVYAYSYTGLAWPAAFLVLWVAAEVALRLVVGSRRRALVADARAWILPIAAGAGVFVVGVLPDLGRIHTFLNSVGASAGGTVGIPKANLGNLAQPLTFRESLGVWLQPDFRFWPPDVHKAKLLALFAMAVIFIAVLRELFRRELAIPAALVGCAALYLYSKHTQSPYVAAKALVVPAPLIALAVGRGWLTPLPLRRWALPATIVAALVAAPYFYLAFRSSYLALRAAQVGPDAHAQELRGLVPLLHGRPTLALFHDDFYQYELLPAPASSPAIGSPLLPVDVSPEKGWAYGQQMDFDTVTANTLDRFDYAITVGTAYQSEPPPNFKLVKRTRSYELWHRVGPTAPRSTLNEAGAPGAILDCKTTAGRALSRRRGVARVRPKPLTESPLPTLMYPGQSAAVTMRLPTGTWELSMQYLSAFRLDVSTAGLRTTVPANLDRPGAFWPIGTVRSTGAPMTLTVHEEKPSSLAASSDAAHLGGAVVATSTATSRTVPLSRACGKYVDWYRLGA